ncbi:hypothetical protein [Klugiella xanthotipulae]|nr:hypothetical protein [Klugiella xanthotipulae]
MQPYAYLAEEWGEENRAEIVVVAIKGRPVVMLSSFLGVWAV